MTDGTSTGGDKEKTANSKPKKMLGFFSLRKNKKRFKYYLTNLTTYFNFLTYLLLHEQEKNHLNSILFIEFIEIQSYPAAQLPLAVPPLLVHSDEVKQVPLR